MGLGDYTVAVLEAASSEALLQELARRGGHPGAEAVLAASLNR